MAGLPLKLKQGTVIHRTTSETLRLSDCEVLSNHNQIRVQNPTRKKSQQTSPSCSFQITGVSLTRYDLGEDSADDLDESHTDDISRVTDNETPSFSEDSRDIDDHQIQIPIPTQQKSTEKNDNNLGRFKVVKIESIAPFSRGRWTCFDYLDQSETSKVSYVYTGYKTHNFEENSSKNVNFWGNNQESFVIQGNYLIHDNYSYKGKNRLRTSCPVSPSFSNPDFSRNTIFHSASTAFRTESVQKPSGLDNMDTSKSEAEAEDSLQSNPASARIVLYGSFEFPKIAKKCPVAVYCFIRNFVGGSVSCTATIDTKIEHALDVVKNHLTHAVRLEVEELKIKINELVDRITYLEYENDLLRANVDAQTLKSIEDAPPVEDTKLNQN